MTACKKVIFSSQRYRADAFPQDYYQCSTCRRLHIRSADTEALNTFGFEIFIILCNLFDICREGKKSFLALSTQQNITFPINFRYNFGRAISTFGLLGFKAIPLKQTIVVFIYVAVFSFIINDLIKLYLFKNIL